MAPSDYRKLHDKHVLVLGGTSGIGLAVAEASLASGAHVTVSSSTQTKINAAVSRFAADYPDRTIQGIATDLSNPQTVEANLENLFTTARSMQSDRPVNHVVLCAADPPDLNTALETLTPKDISNMSRMRMVLQIMLGKVAPRHLPKTTGSSIILTTGVVAEKPSKGWGVVSYFGGGLAALARGLAVDLAPVRVNAVQPGFVDTPMWSAEQREGILALVPTVTLTGQLGRVEDVAEAYVWLMKDGNVTGTVAATDSGALLV